VDQYKDHPRNSVLCGVHTGRTDPTPPLRQSIAPEIRAGCDDVSGRTATEARDTHEEAVLIQGQGMGGFLLELWAFLKERKKFWLLPIIIVLVLFGTLIILAQGSALAPFIYTLF